MTSAQSARVGVLIAWILRRRTSTLSLWSVCVRCLYWARLGVGQTRMTARLDALV